MGLGNKEQGNKDQAGKEKAVSKKGNGIKIVECEFDHRYSKTPDDSYQEKHQAGAGTGRHLSIINDRIPIIN